MGTRIITTHRIQSVGGKPVDNSKPDRDEQINFLDLVRRAIEEASAETSKPRPDTDTLKEVVENAFRKAGVALEIPLELVEFRQSLTGETDRGCALSATARLEDELGHLLRGVFVSDSEVADSVLKGNGPLASLSARIDTAYLLGLISPRAARDLHLIRKIRNIFAHRAGIVRFADPEISDRCKELYHDVWSQRLEPRQKFTRVVMGILGVIVSSKAQVKQSTRASDVDLSHPDFNQIASVVRKEIGF